MLTIWTDKIKHSTVGSSFRVTFSVAPNELEYLNKLYDCFNSMNWSSFPITADRKTEPNLSEIPNSSEKPNNCEELNAYRECVKSRSFWDSKHCDGCYFDERCPFDEPKDEPQKKEVEWVYNKRERLWYPYSNGELLFKTEPTISKMEQVEDEPQNERSE